MLIGYETWLTFRNPLLLVFVDPEEYII